MSSKQSATVRSHWEASRLAMPQPGAGAPDGESWGDLTAGPRGVDYLETEAGAFEGRSSVRTWLYHRHQRMPERPRTARPAGAARWARRSG